MTVTVTSAGENPSPLIRPVRAIRLAISASSTVLALPSPLRSPTGVPAKGPDALPETSTRYRMFICGCTIGPNSRVRPRFAVAVVVAVGIAIVRATGCRLKPRTTLAGSV
jgi:hypothetical protein